MKRLGIVVGIFWFVLALHAEKAHTFSGLLNPRYLIVDNNQIIVSDYPHVYLYSLEDYNLIKKIGGEGMGPGEFHVIQANMNLKERGLVLSVNPDHIAANSTSRLSYFTREGDFIREIKLPYGINAKFLSLGNQLLGFLPLKDGKLSVSLFDKDLEKKKEILNCDYWFNLQSREQASFFDRASDTLFVSVYKDRIYLARGDAPLFAIYVFDFEGNKLFTVEHDSEKLKIPLSFIGEIHEHFKIKFQRGASYQIKNLNLPKHFPAIRNFSVQDDKIYVFTFKNVSQENEVLISDTKGSLLKKVFLPVRAMNPEYLCPFSFYKNKFYQLIFIEETENWELHITDIN
jgi:hypothetical protein